MEALRMFNREGDHFATVTSDNRLKVWEAASGSLRQEYVESEHLTHKYSSIAWATQSPWQGKKSKSKRQNMAYLGIIAVGTTSGSIIIWDLQSGEVKQRLTAEGHVACVNDVCFNSTGSLLYSCADEKYIFEWDVKTGSILRKFRGGKEGTKKVAITADDSKLATASNSIKLWDLSSGKKSSKLTSGHASSVSGLQFSQCSRYLFSSASGGRFINVYECESDNSAPLLNFSLGDSPSDFFAKVEDKDCMLVAVGTNGEVYIWSQSLDVEQSTKPIEAVCTTALSATVKEQMKGKLDVVSGRFASTKKDAVCLARGSQSKPYFETKSFIGDNGDFHSTLDLEVKTTGQVIESSAKKQKHDVNNDAHVISLTDGSSSMAKHNAADVEDDDIAAELTTELENAGKDGKELSLGKRVEALQKKILSQVDEDMDDEQEEFTAAMEHIKPQASSLVSVLEQALQSKDTAMLEYCLRVKDVKIIDTTVQRLSHKRVLAFLNLIVDRFEKRPVRGSHLCHWIHSILMTHTSYLMSVSDLATKLTALYQTLEGRMQNFQELWKLSGRLELVLGQIDQRQHTLEQHQENAQPKKVYNEEDDDENNDDDEDENENDDGSSEEGNSDANDDDDDDDDEDEDDDDDEE